VADRSLSVTGERSEPWAAIAGQGRENGSAGQIDRLSNERTDGSQFAMPVSRIGACIDIKQAHPAAAIVVNFAEGTGATAAWHAVAAFAFAQLIGIVGGAHRALERRGVAKSGRAVDAIQVVAILRLAVCRGFSRAAFIQCADSIAKDRVAQALACARGDIARLGSVVAAILAACRGTCRTTLEVSVALRFLAARISARDFSRPVTALADDVVAELLGAAGPR
jgi:hypothetical protein